MQFTLTHLTNHIHLTIIYLTDIDLFATKGSQALLIRILDCCPSEMARSCGHCAGQARQSRLGRPLGAGPGAQRDP